MLESICSPFAANMYARTSTPEILRHVHSYTRNPCTLETLYPKMYTRNPILETLQTCTLETLYPKPYTRNPIPETLIISRKSCDLEPSTLKRSGHPNPWHPRTPTLNPSRGSNARVDPLALCCKHVLPNSSTLNPAHEVLNLKRLL